MQPYYALWYTYVRRSPSVFQGGGVLTLRSWVKFSFVWYWVCEIFTGSFMFLHFLTTVGEFGSTCMFFFSYTTVAMRRL